jgi:hypothetical protein
MPELRNPDATAFVEYWADRGATSFRAYMHIMPASSPLRLPRHVGFREAAALGIDNLEHGLVVDTEFEPGKRPGEWPRQSPTVLAAPDISGEPVQRTIRELIQHHVAVASTLAVFEVAPPLQQLSRSNLASPSQLLSMESFAEFYALSNACQFSLILETASSDPRFCDADKDSSLYDRNEVWRFLARIRPCTGTHDVYRLVPA